MIKFFFLSLFLLSSDAFPGDLLRDVDAFKKWLGRYEKKIGNCVPKKENNFIILCDQTKLNLTEFKSLFTMNEGNLVSFIRKKKIGFKVICTKKVGKGEFATFCKGDDSPFFKERYGLQGQYKPLENTIYIREDALKGSLIHEYIHYLQYQNREKMFGKAYKVERVALEKKLVVEMDQIIIKVQSLEKKRASKSLMAPFIKRMLKVSTAMKGFSKWQDLIDERSIFQLYILFGEELGATVDDISLAKKNMGHICKRKDLDGVIGRDQCADIVTARTGQYYQSVKEILTEVRDRPDIKIMDIFLDNLPDRPKDFNSKVSAITKYIYTDLKITSDNSYLSRENKNNILPDTTLKLKKGHCVGLSLLYLLAGERWGMDVSLVRIPEHVFIRFCEKGHCVNVETLKKGIVVDDDFYFKNKYMTKKQLQENFYFKSIKKGRRVKSSVYLSLGHIAAKYKQFSLAELFYKKSIDSDRRFAEGYANLSAIYGATNRNRLKRSYTSMALKINPVHVQSMINQAIIDFNDKKEKLAFSHLKQAQEINPYSISVYLTRVLFLKEQEKFSKALINQVMASLLQSKNCKILQDTIDLAGKVKEKSKLKKDLDLLSLNYKKYCR